MSKTCDVCLGAGFIYVRTMHDPDGPREKQECEECHAAPAPVNVAKMQKALLRKWRKSIRERRDDRQEKNKEA